MQKKYQIFVSSTFRDLADERQDAIRSILDLGHIPAGMELFPASDTEQLSYIKKVIDECDYYVLIMGGRYGSLDDDGVSFTEREYDYAVETGKMVLAFPHGDLANLSLAKSEVSESARESLELFRSKVMSGRLVREWKTRDQLDSMIVKALVRAMSDYPAIGWIRGDAVASEDLLAQINALRVAKDQMESELSQLSQSTIPAFENLASLDDEVTMRFSWFDYRASNIQYDTQTLTWREVFRAVAPKLVIPVGRETLKEALQQYLYENRGVHSEISIYQTDIEVIEVQLQALGLTTISTQPNAAGFSVSYVSLSDRGRSEVMEALAVRA